MNPLELFLCPQCSSEYGAVSISSNYKIPYHSVAEVQETDHHCTVPCTQPVIRQTVLALCIITIFDKDLTSFISEAQFMMKMETSQSMSYCCIQQVRKFCIAQIRVLSRN